METEPRPRAVFMAFGTKGDVFPLAAIAAALANDQKHYHVVFISHAEHQNLIYHLKAKNVSYISVSTPSVLSAHQFDAVSDDPKSPSFAMYKMKIKTEHKQECLSAVAKVFGDGPCLKGWSIAELYQIQCVVAAPYVVPYSAPSSFERCFKKEFTLLYKYFHEAYANDICWNDVIHWMWPLFTEEWGSWRSECLHLGSLPFTDPVTNLPMWHMRKKSSLLLYGFSKEIVECPGYWPSNAHVCGFWFLPLEWQFSCSRCREMLSSTSSKCLIKKSELCANHADLQSFLMDESSSRLSIFIGLSSIGSMGFIRNPVAFLSVLEAVIKSTSYRFILFSAGYEPLDAAIRLFSGTSPSSENLSNPNCGKDCRLIFSDRLLCFSGTAPYIWLFPRCAAVVHHGGSGTTAAALHAGVPQILCPFILDQFYWAERLCWLGVAPEPLERQNLVPDNNDATSVKKAADKLTKAINLALSSTMKEQALKIAESLSVEDGVAEALRILREQVINPARDGIICHNQGGPKCSESLTKQ
ncbi:sterol 3-beta-glucosyltransferase isoform X2 [Dendrobium catenatum]|uniref:sterol 3-beta-glucosyltransferase isoform X2 n=1 Tax=Dendrobium catenatum TaxID=906689 RepID=UPI0009F7455E|nr:sterol 3-beta-glucosyltransferase isoform X2 [Dendrobium catenatum]